MGQNKSVDFINSLGQKQLRRRIGCILAVITAAIHQVIPVIVLKKDALPLAHIHHRHPVIVHSRFQPGCPEAHAKRYRHAADQQNRVLFPAEQEHTQQHIASNDPQNDINATCVYRCNRERRKKCCGSRNKSDGPGDEPGNALPKGKPNRSGYTGCHNAVEHKGNNPKGQKIRQDTHKAYQTKIRRT